MMADVPGNPLSRTGVLEYLGRKGIAVQDVLSQDSLRRAALKAEGLYGSRKNNIICKSTL